MKGRRQLRSDCCAFQKLSRDANGEPMEVTSFIVLYADYILRASNPADEILISEMMRELIVGETFYLPEDNPIDFLGMTIVQKAVRCIGLHMRKYIGKLQETKVTDVRRDGKFMLANQRSETLARQITGSLLRIGQLHFEISFDLAMLGAPVEKFALSVGNAKAFLLRPNRAIREIRARMEVFWYHDMMGGAIRSVPGIHKVIALFLVADAGLRLWANRSRQKPS